MMISSKQEKFGYPIYVQIPKLKKPLPLFVLFRAFGIISDKEIQPFSKLNLIAKQKNLKIIDIAKQLEKIKNYSNDFTINY